MRIISTLDSFAKNPWQRLRQLPGLFCEPLFLHQMGKVASVTVANTLNPHYRIFHTHTGIEFEERIHRVFRGKQPEKDAAIITIIRDPLSRRKSVFFQNIVNSPYSFSYSSKEEVLAAGVEHLLERYHAWEDGFTETTEWFDRHFTAQTGVDVYQHPFDPEKGWQIIEQNGWRILILRYNDLNRNFLAGINAFTTTPEKQVTKLETGNVSTAKWYSEILGEFSQALKHEINEVEKIGDSKYMRHFYSHAEIEKYLPISKSH